MHLLKRWAAVALIIATGCVSHGRAYADELASWNEGSAKHAILDFVKAVTLESGPNYVQPSGRIAVFDNDGTLWSEQPAYFQLIFALDRIKAMAPSHPEWASQEPYKSAIAGDLKAVAGQGQKALAELIAATHAGMTTDEFNATVSDWVKTAKHPRTGQLYTAMSYKPMIELLNYLRSEGFKTYIVSGGGVEFMRAWTEGTYGIPPEQVVGSSGKTKFELRDGKAVLIKLPEIEFVDDGPGKPVGINRFIGRRPIFAFGNSDGDLQMLQWTAAGDGLRFMGIVHHTDAAREWAYDRESQIGKLDKALDEANANGWTVVDMKTAWKQVFAFEQ